MSIRKDINKALDELNDKKLKAVLRTVESMVNANLKKAEPEEVKVRRVKKKLSKSSDDVTMSKSELRDRVRKLQVKTSDAGEDLARFLKRVEKLASENTFKQLEKRAEKKGVVPFYGRGRQTPQGKKEKLAAQILVH